MLDRRSRWLGFGLLLMMFVAAVLEGVGVGAVLPFLSVLTDPTSPRAQWVFESLTALTGVEDINSAVFVAAGALLALYVIKNAFLLVTDYARFKYVFSRHVDVATRLFDGYIRRSYEAHMRQSTAEVLRNIDHEVRFVFINVFLPVLVIVIEGLTAIAICVALFWVDPTKTLLIAALLVGVSVSFYLLVRSRTTRLGRQQQKQQTQMLKWIGDAVHAFKEIRVGHKEGHFINSFERSGREFANAMSFYQTVKAIPLRLIEVLGVGAILIVVALAAAQGQEPGSILPELGLFVAAGVRLMPSTNRIVAAVTTVRHYYPALEIVADDLQSVARQRVPTGPVTATGHDWRRVRFDGVTYRYPETTTAAIDELSFDINRGESIAIVGPSGAGKSTVADLLLGLLTPTAGHIVVSPGSGLEGLPLPALIPVGYVPQPSYLLDDTVRRNVAFGHSDGDIDDDMIDGSLKMVRLDDVVRAMPDQLDTRLGRDGGRVSGGQGQRLGIARALYEQPDLLVLDEATSSLDNETEREVSDAIMTLAGKKTLFIIAHRLSTVKRCDRILLLSGGRLIAHGTYDQLMATSGDFQQLVQAGEIHG